jgi:5-deoxy-glucuronate isomerase
MNDPADLLLHSYSLRNDRGKLISVTPETARWQYTGLTVRRLAPGEPWTFSLIEEEVGIVILSGRCTVDACDARWELGERESIFEGKPWALYLPIHTSGRIIAGTACEIAFCTTRAEQSFPPKVIHPDEVEVEIRGAGNACRQINHIVNPEFPAHRLLIVEVFTPSGNWSSYPPHKHDVSDLPREADLEEIYYYRIDPPDGFGLQRLHTADGSFDQAYVIHDGDLLLVPEGYHTFAVAQGYTGYYLNILAGNESIRTMQPSDDPLYAWVRSTWTDQMVEGISSWRDIEQRVNQDAGRRKGK